MREVDVVVIARAADGRAAAVERAKVGRSVVLVDEDAVPDRDDLRRLGIEVLDQHYVWIIEDGGRVGLCDGVGSFLIHATEIIGAPDDPTDDESRSDSAVWERPASAPLRSVPLAALGTEELRAVPRRAAFDRADSRIERDVAAGQLSPFVLSRFRRRAEELMFRLSAESVTNESDIELLARRLERELRSGAAR